MRKAGHILLLFGFSWICFQELSGFLRFGIRQIASEQYETLSPDELKTYTAREVRGHIADATVAAFDARPHMILPGVLMLIGAFMYARESQNKKQQADA